MAPSGPAGPSRPAPGGWAALLSAVLVLAFSALSRTDWAMAREESLAQRCTFVATVLAVGVRLWLRPFVAASTGRTRPPGSPGRTTPTSHPSRPRPVRSRDPTR